MVLDYKFLEDNNCIMFILDFPQYLKIAYIEYNGYGQQNRD